MNFIELYASCNYLHSPKNWLHFQNSIAKFYIIQIKLICLLFISLKHILFLFIVLLVLHQSINIPRQIKNCMHKSIVISIIFLFVSIKQHKKHEINELDRRCIWKIYPFNRLNKGSIVTVNTLKNSCLYLPMSIVRFIVIHLIYLVLIRFLLLTTKHESITKTLLGKSQHAKDCNNMQFIFGTMTSSQFLKVIFERLEAMRISFIFRASGLNYKGALKENLALYISFLSQLLIDINDSMFTISNTHYIAEK